MLRGSCFQILSIFELYRFPCNLSDAIRAADVEYRHKNHNYNTRHTCHHFASQSFDTTSFENSLIYTEIIGSSDSAVIS